MKKYKIEIILGTVFFSFLVLLMWETLSSYWTFLPPLLIALAVLIVLMLVINVKKKGESAHEVYAPKYFAQIAIVTVVTIAITVMVALILNKNNFSKNFDLTTNKINSLSDESKKLLDSFDNDVQIICIPGQNLADNYCDSSADLIRLYEKQNKHIINLGTLDLRDRTLLSRIQPMGFSRLVLITHTNKSEVTGNITESKLTNALINLIKYKKTIYFLTGHGEPELTASNSEKSYSEIVSSLEGKAYTVQSVDPINSTIPLEASVLIAGDNTIPYDAHTENELTKFIARGGKLILIVNPYREQGLAKLYAHLNLKPRNILLTLNKNTALGKQLAKQNLLRPPVVMSEFNAESPITSVISQVYGSQASIPIDGARPFSILDSTDAPIKTETTVLMYAVQAAPITLTEAERNKINLLVPMQLNPDTTFEAKTSWPIGFDVEILNASALSTEVKAPAKDEDNKSEVVVYGFSLVNQYSAQTRVTEELIPLTIAHLYKDKELISVPTRNFAPKQFNFSRNPGGWVLLFAGFLPVCTAIAGIFIWARRRKA